MVKRLHKRKTPAAVDTAGVDVRLMLGERPRGERVRGASPAGRTLPYCI